MSFFRCLITCCGIFILATAHTAIVRAATVESVRVWRAPDHTRVVLDLDGPVQHNLILNPQPNSVVVDVPDADLKASLIDLPLTDTPIVDIRSAPQTNKDLRLIIELKKTVTPSSFFLKAHSGIHDRLVIDLYDETPVITTAAASATVSSQAITEKPTLEKIVPAETSGNRNLVIAIDAGHGGEDPGAIGPNRLREKEVTLAIAKELITVINTQPGFTGKLIRTGDYFIPLKKRRDLARSMKADLFVSIHADAFTKASAKGASVFALSMRGATSETARFLAQRENESDLIGGVGDISLDDKDQMLAGVLVDLSMTATLNSSLQVGHSVLNEMSDLTHLHKRRVEQAGFMVLKSPDVPSILVETGFISNKEESRKLATPVYRKQIAQSVFRGIQKHFTQNPPPGTLLAALKYGNKATPVIATQEAQPEKKSEHKVEKGDTLSHISRLYGVSVAELLKHNKMKNPALKVGQTLKIPNT
jgi:N-acetylmuramoyl-L-alanine amidase